MSQPRVLLLDENRGFGGAERHAVSLAKELRARELLASLVGRKDSWLCKEAGKTLPFTPCGFRNEVDMFSVFSIYKMVKSFQANVLHCIAHRDLVAAALARQLPGAPPTALLKAEHSFPDDELSPLFRWAYRQCDGVACVSVAMQSALKEKLQSDNPEWDCEFGIIPNGVELGPQPTPRPPRAGGAAHKIGVLSALRPGKGQADFLQALSALPSESRGRLEISLAGDGELRAELERQARELGLAVDFRGHVEDPAAYLQSLDLCVLPSHTETFSLVALECLTLGVPLLAADSQGVAELYPEGDMLYPRGAHGQLAARVEAYLANPDPFAHRALELCQRYRRDYSRERMGEQYQDLYQKLLSRAVVTT
jgi:glycosyltransferase involved in cell wall biosynthesis